MNITIKLLKIVLFITMTQCLLSISCNKDSSRPCSMVTPYSFNVTSEFSPQKEIYNVGDTVYLTSTFPKKLTNLISNQQLQYTNSIGVGGNISFSMLDTINKQVEYALNKFNVKDLLGNTTELQNSTTKNAGKNILFYESDIKYEFKIAIILNQKGLYMIGVTDLSSQGLRGQNCTNAGFNMTVTNTNKNLHLFQYALGYTPDALLQKYIYCFRVQ
ncbi:MAG: hypothetical protein ACOYVG_09555 [Bacteroidota bacterium]